MADIDDLRATFEQAITALNKRDLEAVLAADHDQHIFFGPDVPFAVDRKVSAREGQQAFFANTESATLTLINPQYRVIGSTGISWGHYRQTLKPKDGPLSTVFGRYLSAFVKSEGKWIEVAAHLSRLPSRN